MATGQQEWWKLPLPPGWEAKYDQNQRRYFYLNHQNKQTTWNDPRQDFYAKQAQQQQSRVGTSATVSSAGQSIPMQTLGRPKCATCHEKEVRREGEDCWNCKVQNEYKQKVSMVDVDSDKGGEGYNTNDWESDSDVSQMETSFVQADEEKAKKLKDLFPGAQLDHIKKTLERNHNVEAMAELDLKADGYEKAAPKPQYVSGAWKQLSTNYPSAGEEMVKDVLRNCYNEVSKAQIRLEELGYKKVIPQTAASTRPQQPSTTTPSPPKISAAQKTKIKNQFLNDAKYKDVMSNAIINIALETCNYDAGKIKTLLDSMLPSEETCARSPKKTTAPTEIIINTPASVSGSTSDARTSDTKDVSVYNTTTQSSSVSNYIDSSATTSAGTQQTKITQPAALTRAKQVDRAPAEMHAKKWKTPSSYVSEERIKPQGPNAELIKGSDRTIVISEYQTTHGPNRDLRHGPNRSLIHGPGGYQGCDPSLVQGPMRDVQLGPNPYLVNGPRRVVGSSTV